MELQVFKNDEFGAVRTAVIGGVPWFSGKDVAEILGYGNTRNAVTRHVDAEDRCAVKCGSLGGVQDTVLINESGLYSLILRSRLPKAREFKRWVTSEILPAIRRHGLYASDGLLENPDLAVAALTRLKEEREMRLALEEASAGQIRRIAELQPKACYYDLILQSSSTVPVTQIAKEYGMSARAFNEMLRLLGVQYKVNGAWVLYQKYAGRGYMQSRTLALDATKCAMRSYWTQRGRLFLYDLLKRNGVLPLIERRDSPAESGTPD